MPLYEESHGGEDVSVYAQGPCGHLFHRTHEQNYVAHVIMYASCTGKYKDIGRCRAYNTSQTQSPALKLLILLAVLTLLKLEASQLYS